MAIKVSYDGLSSDINILTTNVKSICDSLDTLNRTDSIVPESWTSPASVQYRHTVDLDLVAHVADLEGSLTGLIKLLVNISDSFNNLENIISNDLKSWYDNLDSNGKIYDFLPTTDQPTTPSADDTPTTDQPTIPSAGDTPTTDHPTTTSRDGDIPTADQPTPPSDGGITSPLSQTTTPSDGFNSDDYDFVDKSGNTAISFDDDVSVSSNISNSSTSGGSNDNLDLSFTDDEGKTTIHFD